MVTPSFRTRARVINQLGEQLIKNESIALLELIKNSYDGDSSECSVLMTQPVQWLNLDKAECINYADGAYDLEFIKQKLEDKLKDVNIFRFYNDWENIINQSTKEFIHDISTCFELDENWSANTEFLIYKLYKTFSEHGDDFSNHEKLQSAFHLLNRSFLGKLESLTRDVSTDHIEFFDCTTVSSIFYNKYLKEGGYFSTKYSNVESDLTKYTLNSNITTRDRKRVSSKINKIINDKIIGDDNIAKLNSALFLSDPSRPDVPGSIFCLTNDEMKNIVLDSTLDNAANVEANLCFVLLTPECDIANKKAIIHRAAYGVMLSNLKGKKTQQGDQFFKIGPFWYEDKIQHIIINFQTISTIHIDELDSYSIHLALKRDLFFDLQSKASNHVNRLGNYQLS